jgi:outer membrane protein assembly factor BamD
MSKHALLFSLIAAFGLLFTGCGQKTVSEFNQPAAFWYDKMIHEVGMGSLEKADGYYSSLQSEHIGSPLLGEATIILAMAHIRQGEFLLGEHFLNEYIKRYADAEQREFAAFLKIKAKYLALPNVRRDQGLIDAVIAEGEQFKKRYPRSIYLATVDTMVTRLYLAQAALNESIASLYDRLDKPRAAAYYRSLKPQPWIDWKQVEPAESPWYKAIFEGDGGESWYAFLIPDTQSVVSRNSEGLARE